MTADEEGTAPSSEPKRGSFARQTLIEGLDKLVDGLCADRDVVRNRRTNGDVYDAGFTACANEFIQQAADPSHPITRNNPFRTNAHVSDDTPTPALYLEQIPLLLIELREAAGSPPGDDWTEDLFDRAANAIQALLEPRPTEWGVQFVAGTTVGVELMHDGPDACARLLEHQPLWWPAHWTDLRIVTRDTAGEWRLPG